MTDAPHADLDRVAVERELARRGALVGTPLSIVAETASTNDDARRAALAGAPHGATFIAECQRAGRGRGDHAWYSPPGQNLYLSVVARPEIGAAALTPLALVVGLVVARAVERCGARSPVLVKWPNDVLVEGKKVAGVLLEAHIRGDRASHVVIGVGINVHVEAFPAEIAAHATSLRLLGAAHVDRSALAAGLLEDLGLALAAFDRSGFAAFHNELIARDALLGEPVRVEDTSGGTISGVAMGIDVTGRLLVRGAAGVVAIASGTVTLLEHDGAAG